MPKEKTKAKAKRKKGPSPDVQKQPEAPEKKGGPLPATRSAKQLSAAGSAGRAQMVSDMQGSVGNTRVARLVDQAGGEPESEANHVARQVTDETPPAGEVATPGEEPAGTRPAGVQRAGEEEGDLAQRQPATQGPGAEEEQTPAQMKGKNAAPGRALSPELEAEIQAARQGGQPLPEELRVQLEHKLGADLRGVRVHTDEKADRLARALNARAFTVGRHVFFKRGEYDPDSTAGRELLVHELVHARH